MRVPGPTASAATLLLYHPPEGVSVYGARTTEKFVPPSERLLTSTGPVGAPCCQESSASAAFTEPPAPIGSPRKIFGASTFASSPKTRRIAARSASSAGASPDAADQIA